MEKREIKFRVWDEENGMVFFDLHTLCKKGDDVFVAGFEENGIRYVAPIDSLFNAMQFTGLKDKNGKEIYEGDIVKCHTKQKKRESIGKVIFSNLRFTIDTGESISDCTDLTRHTEFHNNENFEIIGNIYYNPELISE